MNPIGYSASNVGSGPHSPVFRRKTSERGLYGRAVFPNLIERGGHRVAPATYFVRLQAGGEAMTRKVVVLGE